MQLIEENHGDLDEPVMPDGCTLVHLAVKQGLSNVVRALMHHTNRRNDQDVDGNTPLHLAYKFGFYECVSILLDSECQEEIENKLGLLPAEL